MSALTPEAVAAGGPCAATPADVLRDHIMNSSVAKSEAEWWAARRIKALEAALRPFAEQRTIAEMMAGAEEPEWLDASVERRIEMMGERKRKRDYEILDARALLQADPQS